jgi:hypothetical protein
MIIEYVKTLLPWLAIIFLQCSKNFQNQAPALPEAGTGFAVSCSRRSGRRDRPDNLFKALASIMLRIRIVTEIAARPRRERMSGSRQN